MNQTQISLKNALNHQRLIRSSCRMTTITSSIRPQHPLLTYFSSTPGNDRRREKANTLRAFRKGRNRDHGSKHDETADYRYRRREGDTHVKSVQTLWGDAAVEAEEERKRINSAMKDAQASTKHPQNLHNRHYIQEKNGQSSTSTTSEFVSFFDQVDEKMGWKNGQKLPPSDYSSERSNIMHSGSTPSSTDSISQLFNSITRNNRIESTLENESRVSTTHTDKDADETTSKPKTIFDAFSVKSNKVRNPNAYAKEPFREYHNAMKDILTSDKFQRRRTKNPLESHVLDPVMHWLLKDEKFVPYDYTTLKTAAENGITQEQEQTHEIKNTNETKETRERHQSSFRPNVSISGTQSNSFYTEVGDQRDVFLSKANFTEEQIQLCVRAFDVLASNCAQSAKSVPLSIAWEKMKEAGMVPSNDTLNVLLYVTGTIAASGFLSTSLTSRSSSMTSFGGESAVMSILGGTATGDAKDSETNQVVDFPTELAIAHDLLYTPTEKSISLRVKRLVSIGDASGAEYLLDSFPSNDDARLRTYLPVLKLYCGQGKANSALRLFKRMREEPSVRLEPEHYVLLIAMLTENGYFCSNSEPIEGAKDIGYMHACGAKLFDELVTEMSEDALEITSASARRLFNSLVIGTEKEAFSNKLEPIHSLAGVMSTNETADPNDLIASRVAVEKSTGLCPRSGVKLRLIKLEKDEQKQLHKSLLELSKHRFEEFNQLRNGQDDDYAAEKLNQFAQWLDDREGKPFTAIVDGANAAYYMQNFHGGRFNYHQLQFMVDALEKTNENPLVVIPYKYCKKSFNIQMGSTYRQQVLSAEERRILSNLTKKGQLYRVPSRCLDDYYWMLASVSDQTRSRSDANLDVAVDNEEGRWPGTRPMLVTNDQMRDHKLGLLEPRLFRRWTSCFIVNYSFTAFVGSESVDKEIGFSTADFFSREIQSNQTGTGTAWHFPVSDWNLNDRFCVRIPST